VREATAFALRRFGDATAIPALLKALADPESTVRAATAFALGEIRDPVTIPNLLRALADPESIVRQASAMAMGEIGDSSALPALLGALADPESSVRRAVAWALRQFKDPTMISPVLLAWQRAALNDRSGLEIYDLLARLAPLAYPTLSTEWHGLRHDLLPPTSYTLALGLAPRQEWASLAEAAYRQVLERLPAFAPAVLELARLLMRWPGRTADARDVLERHLQHCPSDAEAMDLLGASLSLIGEYDRAVAAFRQAVLNAQDTMHKATYLRHCVGVCLELGHLDDAEKDLRGAEELHPDSWHMHALWSMLQLERGQQAHALSRAGQAAQTRDAPAAAHFALGLALLAGGQNVLAGAAFEQGIHRAEDWGEIASAMQDLRRQQTRQGELPGAEEVLPRLQTARDRLVARWPPAP